VANRYGYFGKKANRTGLRAFFSAACRAFAFSHIGAFRSGGQSGLATGIDDFFN